LGGIWQGAVCELPLPSFATGIMRGRFGADGALYACGLFGWAGNAPAPGGFHRVRATGRPAYLPLGVHVRRDGFELRFSDPLDTSSVEADSFALKVWSLKRSADYGSKHIDEHQLSITAASLSNDGRTVSLTVPDLAPTQCYELVARVRGADGTAVTRSLHGTIHKLPGP